MKNLKKFKTYIGITVAMLAMFAVIADTPATAEAAPPEQPGLSVPMCESGGRISMYWHTEHSGAASAPAGWRVERWHWDSNYDLQERAWEFIGADSDHLQTYSDEYWDWVDTTASRDLDYTYRVIALDENGDFANGRAYSRRAPEFCN